MWCFIVFLLAVPSCCTGTDAADSGWACCSHIIHCPAFHLLTPPTLMSSSEHNLCLPVSSWEPPTSKPRIWIIKLLFLAFPLHITDLTSWSSPPSLPCLSSVHAPSCEPLLPPSFFLSISSALCRSLICTRSSSRFRTRGRKPTWRTTTDHLESAAGNNK